MMNEYVINNLPEQTAPIFLERASPEHPLYEWDFFGGEDLVYYGERPFFGEGADYVEDEEGKEEKLQLLRSRYQEDEKNRKEKEEKEKQQAEFDKALKEAEDDAKGDVNKGLARALRKRKKAEIELQANDKKLKAKTKRLKKKHKKITKKTENSEAAADALRGKFLPIIEALLLERKQLIEASNAENCEAEWKKREIFGEEAFEEKKEKGLKPFNVKEEKEPIPDHCKKAEEHFDKAVGNEAGETAEKAKKEETVSSQALALELMEEYIENETAYLSTRDSIMLLRYALEGKAQGHEVEVIILFLDKFIKEPPEGSEKKNVNSRLNEVFGYEDGKIDPKLYLDKVKMSHLLDEAQLAERKKQRKAVKKELKARKKTWRGEKNGLERLERKSWRGRKKAEKKQLKAEKQKNRFLYQARQGEKAEEKLKELQNRYKQQKTELAELKKWKAQQKGASGTATYIEGLPLHQPIELETHDSGLKKAAEYLTDPLAGTELNLLSDNLSDGEGPQFPIADLKKKGGKAAGKLGKSILQFDEIQEYGKKGLFEPTVERLKPEKFTDWLYLVGGGLLVLTPLCYYVLYPEAKKAWEGEDYTPLSLSNLFQLKKSVVKWDRTEAKGTGKVGSSGSLSLNNAVRRDFFGTALAKEDSHLQSLNFNPTLLTKKKDGGQSESLFLNADFKMSNFSRSGLIFNTDTFATANLTLGNKGNTGMDITNGQSGQQNFLSQAKYVMDNPSKIGWQSLLPEIDLPENSILLPLFPEEHQVLSLPNLLNYEAANKELSQQPIRNILNLRAGLSEEVKYRKWLTAKAGLGWEAYNSFSGGNDVQVFKVSGNLKGDLGELFDNDKLKLSLEGDYANTFATGLEEDNVIEKLALKANFSYEGWKAGLSFEDDLRKPAHYNQFKFNISRTFGQDNLNALGRYRVFFTLNSRTSSGNQLVWEPRAGLVYVIGKEEK